MKKNLLSLACCGLAFIIVVSSCRVNTLRGEGNKVTSSPSVSSFDGVDIALPLTATINVKEGSQPGITINGYENLVKHIKTKFEGSTLRLVSDLDETWTMDYDGITVQITLPVITSLSVEGAGRADVHGNITGAEFSLDISGASRAVIDNISVDHFTSEVSGASNVEVKGGNVKQAKYEVSGASKIETFPLQSAETSASVSGAGKGEVTALQKLYANASGASSIKYKGHPSVTKDVSGAGNVDDAN